MCNGQLFGVEKVTIQAPNMSPYSSVLDRIVAAASIGFVTNNWMSEPGKVNTNLVRPARS